MKRNGHKTYLGDAVYAEMNNRMIMLTVSYGNDNPSDIIYLEMEVYDALTKWVKKMKED